MEVDSREPLANVTCLESLSANRWSPVEHLFRGAQSQVHKGE